MILSKEIIEKGKSERGGWNRYQLGLLGIPWPPVRGWQGTIIGRDFPEQAIRNFLHSRSGGSAKPLRKSAAPRASLPKDVQQAISDRAKAMVSSQPGPIGSATFTCTAASCTYPKCMCGC